MSGRQVSTCIRVSTLIFAIFAGSSCQGTFAIRAKDTSEKQESGPNTLEPEPVTTAAEDLQPSSAETKDPPSIPTNFVAKFEGFQEAVRDNPTVHVYNAILNLNKVGLIHISAIAPSTLAIKCSTLPEYVELKQVTSEWLLQITPKATGAGVVKCSAGDGGDLTINLTVAPTPCAELAGGVLYGSGSLQDPFLICNGHHMAYLSDNRDLWSKSFRLGNDIDASVMTKPLGFRDEADAANATAFTGTFDGAGYKISNLGLSRAADEGNLSTALFAFVSGAVIEDLELDSPVIRITSAMNSGLLVGYLTNSRLRNISIKKGQILTLNDGDTGARYSAALVGTIADNVGTDIVSITDVDIEVTAVGANVIGGGISNIFLQHGSSFEVARLSVRGAVTQKDGSTVAGSISHIKLIGGSHGAISDIFNDANVTRLGPGWGFWSGALLGTVIVEDNSQFTATNLVNRGNFVGDVANTVANGYLGTMVGTFSLKTNSSAVMSKIGSTGNLTVPGLVPGNRRYLGGLIGSLAINASTVQISDFYYSGQIEVGGSEQPRNIGGAIGGLSCAGGGSVTLLRGYSQLRYTGTPSEATTTASLIGSATGCFPGESTWSASGLYFNIDQMTASMNVASVPYATVAGQITGKSTAEFGVQANFPEFDFSSTWKINTEKQHPDFKD